MTGLIQGAQQRFSDDFSDTTLRAAILLVALILILVSLKVNNKWILAGVLAYVALP